MPASVTADERVCVLVLADTHLGPGRGGVLIDLLGDRLDGADMFPDADVVFDHSHLPWNQTIEVAGHVHRHFNPGSPTQRRRAPTRSIGWIDIDRSGLRCRHEHPWPMSFAEVRRLALTLSV